MSAARVRGSGFWYDSFREQTYYTRSEISIWHSQPGCEGCFPKLPPRFAISHPTNQGNAQLLLDNSGHHRWHLLEPVLGQVTH